MESKNTNFKILELNIKVDGDISGVSIPAIYNFKTNSDPSSNFSDVLIPTQIPLTAIDITFNTKTFTDPTLFNTFLNKNEDKKEKGKKTIVIENATFLINKFLKNDATFYIKCNPFKIIDTSNLVCNSLANIGNDCELSQKELINEIENNFDNTLLIYRLDSFINVFSNYAKKKKITSDNSINNQFKCKLDKAESEKKQAKKENNIISKLKNLSKSLTIDDFDLKEFDKADIEDISGILPKFNESFAKYRDEQYDEKSKLKSKSTAEYIKLGADSIIKNLRQNSNYKKYNIKYEYKPDNGIVSIIPSDKKNNISCSILLTLKSISKTKRISFKTSFKDCANQSNQLKTAVKEFCSNYIKKKNTKKANKEKKGKNYNPKNNLLYLMCNDVSDIKVSEKSIKTDYSVLDLDNVCSGVKTGGKSRRKRKNLKKRTKRKVYKKRRTIKKLKKKRKTRRYR